MTSKPKLQENAYRSKSVTPEGKCRRNSTSNAAKPPEKTIAEISMKDFLDFLKISYQVNEAVENDDASIKEKVDLDWKRLTNNALINQLSGQDHPANQESGEGKRLSTPSDAGNNDDDDKTEPNRKNFESCNKVPSKSSCQTPEEKLSESDDLDDEDGKSTSFESGDAGSLRERKLEKKSKKKRNKNGSDGNESEKAGEGATAKLLKKKLSEVLQEGIMDSVLPYLLPKQEHQFNLLQPPIKKFLLSGDLKKSSTAVADRNGMNAGKKDKDNRRKSFTDSEKSGKIEQKDADVVIHVCDEMKNLKKDFRCPQRLLVKEMGYFAEVTNGQKLEDMDISVHCDVTIFDWLMKWVQKDNSFEESWPRLDPAIVIPVLLSSAFLQMDTLQEHCLKYCKSNINDILRDSSSLTCLNDSILTRLANMFSNSDVENFKDKKDKLQSRMYCKLILALSEPQPQPQRGHYSTVATMYRCSKCSKLILRNISSSILCVPSCMMMDQNGFVISSHIRDPNWNLTDYVKSLKSDLKLWKKVYWRLWSDCHLLFCHTCSSYFPVHQMYWCRYHSESAQFFTKDNQRSLSVPLGRYPCCGERAYRFEILKNKQGCQYREHTTDPKSDVEKAIYKLWTEHRDLIKTDPPQIVPTERVRHHTKSREEIIERNPAKDSFWWEGLQLVPPRPKIGLFGMSWDKVLKKDDARTAITPLEPVESRMTTTKKGNQSSPNLELSSSSDSSDQQSSASDAGDSEDSGPKAMRVSTKPKSVPNVSQSVATQRFSCVSKWKRKKKRKRLKALNKNEGCQFWVPKLSTRCNQDNQREFEERAFRQIESVLGRKLSSDSLNNSSTRLHYQNAPPGGIYVKLEQEWREAHCNVHGCPGSSVKAKASSSVHGNVFANHSSSSRSRTRTHRL
ncbi:UNVERIFIED_CONTAM: hypothetical protein PYX00_009364 [Menopon gallinae]|uniref:SANT and BTB domain-containing protein n=1 Tax=Menopon gallinae TaxID=328185 RepID=A0AAW2HBP8_9NEOP